MFTKKFLILLTIFSFCSQTFGQGVSYKSAADDNLTIRSLSVAPIVDNVDGIYAKALTLTLHDAAKEDRQWDVKEWSDSKPVKPEELEEKADLVKSWQKKIGVDAILATRISKGPSGISIKLDFFSGAEGFLTAQESLNDYSGFETSDLKAQIKSMFDRIKIKLPYSGIVLSRKGQTVTFNLGKSSGIQQDNPISVVQILKVSRHPKFKFIVGMEKEILGKIRVTKVDDYVSFGVIEFEREHNVIKPNMKLMPVNFVKYPIPSVTPDGKVMSDLSERKDNDLSFGESPKEWAPKPPATFGKVAVLFGLGTYSISNNLITSGGVEDDKKFVPSMHFKGEMWLTKNWFFDLNLKQFVFSVANNLSNSTPSTLNVSALETNLDAGYFFLINDDFFGPKFQLSFGYTKFQGRVDESSPPAFTTLNFSGMNLGIGGSFPMDNSNLVTIGGKLNYFLSSSVDESPTQSGSSNSATISSFTLFGDYKWTESMRWVGEVSYELFGASFSGTGTRAESASSASHNIFTMAFGVEYRF